LNEELHLSPPRRRVLFVGSTTYDLPLSPALARKWDAIGERLELRVIARGAGGDGQDPRFRLIRSRFRAAAGAQFFGLLPVLVASELRAFRPEIVIAQSAYEAAAALPAIRLLRPRPKLVVEIHSDPRTAARLYGSPLRRLYAGLSDRVALAALRGADATRAVSTYTAALAREATGDDAAGVFPAYFDLGSFLSKPPTPLPATPQAAWVGVLQRAKNPALLARAWRLLAQRMPDARLVVVGQGPLQAEVDALASELPDSVRLVPWVSPSEVARTLDESTLLTLTSTSEGLGRVILEAFARGRPVIAAKVGGVPDLVEDGRNGLLVPPDDPEALAAALERVLRDRPLAERLGHAAATDAEQVHWTPDRYANALAALIEGVLDGA
jgi:glycosyltransferase involved in cell wall biosynthesis